MSSSRRDFLREMALLFGGGVFFNQTQEPKPKMKVMADPLPDPDAIGQTRDKLDALDNDPTIIAIEHKLHCTCGCTLDIYTCRTTDFTCTYSPALHREIRSMFAAGKTPQQIVDFFVAREGAKVLMAPPPQGFNLAGYLVPGSTVAVAGLLLAAYLSRKRQAALAPAPLASGMPSGGVAPPPDAAQLEKLRRALDEMES